MVGRSRLGVVAPRVTTGYDPTAYGAAVADVYDDLYRDDAMATAAAVRCLRDLAGGGAVLELGIGTGRLALPLAAAGLRVHGIDASPEMLDRLAAKPGGSDIDVTLADFSSFEVPGRFTLAILAFNTIFALPDQDAQVACFANAARHLAPGGAFVVEAWIPDVGAFRHNRLVRPRIMQEARISIETVELDPVDQMMRTTQAVFSEGSVRLYPANHRYAWPAELDLMARLAGMRRELRWEDWSGTPFGSESRTHVTVYRRA